MFYLPLWFVVCRIGLSPLLFTMKTYAEKLKDPRWQKRRLLFLERNKWTCKKCGDTKTELHVHHKNYKKNCDPWNYEDVDLDVLCKHCHFFVEEVKDVLNYDSCKIQKSIGKEGGRLMFISYCFKELNIPTFFIVEYDDDDNIKASFFLEAGVVSQLKKSIRYFETLKKKY